MLRSWRKRQKTRWNRAPPFRHPRLPLGSLHSSIFFSPLLIYFSPFSATAEPCTRLLMLGFISPLPGYMSSNSLLLSKNWPIVKLQNRRSACSANTYKRGTVLTNIFVCYFFSENLAGKISAWWHFSVTFDAGHSDLPKDTNFKFAVF